MGHQAGKLRDITEVDKFLDWLKELEYGIFNIPIPDETILLYMPVEIGQQLVDKKGHRDYVGEPKEIFMNQIVVICRMRQAHIDT
jgi:dTMP kinase